jgi:pimeloyl-ACP methyl ester carboxylesterase
MDRRTFLLAAGGLALAAGVANADEKPARDATQKVPAKALPFPGEVFAVADCPAFLISPGETDRKGPLPWVWYAPTLPGLPENAEKWMFERFLKAGIAIAGIDVGESYGSPKGREKFSALHKYLVEQRKLSTKPVLLARSRGGLQLLSWACDHPDQVGGFAGIYPVCSIASYPGVDKAAGAFELSADQLKADLAKYNPVDQLAALARAKVPLFAIHGDVDTVVPLELNSGEVARRYRALGGAMELIVPPGQGHNMWAGFFECRELVDFVLKCVDAKAK